MKPTSNAHHHDSMKPKLKLSIVDDNEAYRESLRLKLSTNEYCRLYNEFSTSKDFLASLNSPFKPDICILDVVLPNESGLECGNKAKKMHPDLYIVFVTAYPTMEGLKAARALRADYIEKGSIGEVLLEHIIPKLAHEKTGQLISLKDEEEMLPDYFAVSAAVVEAKKNLDTLSEKQKQVLRLRKQGMSIEEIAGVLQVSVNTVKTHQHRAAQKLELPDWLDLLDIGD